MPAIAEIVENFKFLDDWDDRYRYIIELGEGLGELPPELKTDEYRVAGCASHVWLVPSTAGGRMRYRADSDAMIVKGLLAILLAVFDDKPPQEIAEFDPEPLFVEMDLRSHISPQRSSGLIAMLDGMRAAARAALQSEAPAQ